MRCGKIKRRLALYVGGDLPAEEEEALLMHIESCARCAEEYKSLMRSRAVMEDLIRRDRCAEPPPDLSDRIIDAIRKREQTPVCSPEWRRRFPGWRMAAACFCVLIVLVSGYGLIRSESNQRSAQLRHRREEVLRMAERDKSEIVLKSGRILGIAIQGPCHLDDWKPPESAGIYALLHKPDSENKPDTYIIDYIGENERLTPDTILPLCAKGDTYIAVFRMKDSSEHERQRITAALVQRFSPRFN
jgi:hypothetical protein